MALITAISGSSNIRSDRLVIDMAPQIAWLEPDAYPLLSLTRRISKKVATNGEFKALEMDAQARSTTTSGTATAAATTVTVTDYTVFVVGDIVENTRTHEKLEIGATPTTSTVTISRSVGTTAAAAMLTGDELLIIGNAHAEGAALGAIRTQQTDLFSNYTQIMRKPFGVTGSTAAYNLYGGDELNIKAKAQGIIHAQDIERAGLFGEKAIDSSGTHPKRYTGGVISFISTNVIDAGGTLTELSFENFLIKAFRYGSEQKLLLVSPNVLGTINSWARGKIQVSPAEKTYGMKLMTYQSGQGAVTLIKHKLLEGAIYKGYAILLDMKDVTYRYVKGRDTHIRIDVGTPGDDSRTDEYLTECGFQITNEKKHAVIKRAA